MERQVRLASLRSRIGCWTLADALICGLCCFEASAVPTDCHWMGDYSPEDTSGNASKEMWRGRVLLSPPFIYLSQICCAQQYSCIPRRFRWSSDSFWQVPSVAQLAWTHTKWCENYKRRSRGPQNLAWMSPWNSNRKDEQEPTTILQDAQLCSVALAWSIEVLKPS